MRGVGFTAKAQKTAAEGANCKFLLFRFGSVKATIYEGMIGAGHALSMPRGNPILRLGIWDLSPVDDRQEVAIETANDPVFTAEQIGWRFALGTLVLVGAYVAWPLIPVVMMTDLEPGAKAGLSGLLGATPFMSKFIALGIMGRPAYYFLKRNLFTRIRRGAARPAE